MRARAGRGQVRVHLWGGGFPLSAQVVTGVAAALKKARFRSADDLHVVRWGLEGKRQAEAEAECETAEREEQINIYNFSPRLAWPSRVRHSPFPPSRRGDRELADKVDIFNRAAAGAVG